jgi:hypothetical protein
LIHGEFSEEAKEKEINIKKACCKNKYDEDKIK